MKSKLRTLVILYFVQGIPYGIQSGLLPIYLRSVGVSLTRISLAKLLYFPWILKMLWAPLVDWYGTKQKWLLGSMYGLAFSFLIISGLSPEIHFLILVFMLMMINFFASVQDIIVDGLAVKILSVDEIGYGNTIQVVSYKMGSALAGGGLLTVIDLLGWRILFIMLTGIYVGAIIYALCAPELQASLGMKPKLSTLNPWVILEDLLRVPGTVWTMIYVIIYKLGEQCAVNMFPLFLLDNGISAAQLGFWNGMLGMAFSIFGSCLCGALMAKYNPFSLTKALFILRLGSLIFQTFLLFWFQRDSQLMEGAVMLSIILQSFLGGLITTLTFSIMMLCSQKAEEKIQATHYSFLATLEVLGKLTFGIMGGVIVDGIGFRYSFCVFLALSLLSILHVLNPPKLAPDKLSK
ncbi:major facilitator superfamily domain-containing protein 3 [Callorhinchus milii]|uniref:Major facilitator superfamily domain-containing protein 3 n=1 Tax=Callorhinchus milii TaxID=7868 RepID=A0A4W3IGS5_CALMI|nr:major facilitator superfamily domain-containing protein 3 [Callorhinchus milii]|eukprot:gi/632962869/ref/XP_007897562.1/ PREDICTED: major facilitator superfamily domain-containing protein 3 [Callorhinchus milii]